VSLTSLKPAARPPTVTSNFDEPSRSEASSAPLARTWTSSLEK
jgi:hypothetical protein